MILLATFLVIAVGAGLVLTLASMPNLADSPPSDEDHARARYSDEFVLADLAGPVLSLRERLVTLLSGAVERVDQRGMTVALLARARVPLRSGELVSLTVLGGALLGGVVWLLSAQWVLGLCGFLVSPLVARALLAIRITRRERQFEDELPDAVSMVAASMNGGHTFHRSIQIVSQEMNGPAAEEFSRVIREVRLGHNMVEALQRMAERVQLESVDLLVNAVRIQHHLGGSMAELLHTIADSIRARQELHREVRVLTAEGRMSAWLLGALPVLLLVLISGISPDYSAPLFQGWGFVWLAGCVVSVAAGVFWIRKMSEVDV